MAAKRASSTTNNAGSRSIGRRLILPAVLIIILGVLVAFLLIDPFAGGGGEESVPSLGPAPIAFEPASVDFGNMPVGSRQSTSVRLTNTGTSPLRILATRTSCVCLSADLPMTTLQPGGTTSMALTIDALTTPGTANFAAIVLVAGYDPLALSVQRTTVAQ